MLTGFDMIMENKKGAALITPPKSIFLTRIMATATGKCF